MLKIFKHNSVMQVLVILLIVVLMWGKAFLQPATMPTSHYFAPIYELLYQLLCNLPRMASAIGLVLVLVEGIWLNMMLYNHKLIGSNSLLPLLLYVVAMSWNPDALTLTPMLVVNIFILLASNQLMSNGSTTLGFERNFNAAFCIGLAAMTYLPAIAYTIPFLLLFVVYKMYRWRDFVVSIFGLIAPIILLVTYAYLTDKLHYYSILTRYDVTNWGVNYDTSNVWQTILNVTFLLMMVVMLIWTLFQQNDLLVHQRINRSVMLLPLIGAIDLLFYTQLLPADTQAMAPALAYMGTLFFPAERKRKWINETLLDSWLVMGILNI